MKRIATLVLVFAVLLLPPLGEAKVGVGVATGKIEVDQDLEAGGVYNLPPFTVVNTGDEPSEYEVSVQQLLNQEELVVDASWVEFEPQRFSLEPGKGQNVHVKITLPVDGVQPGDYFAFLEAMPVRPSQEGGGTSIGIAAATKLYFTVSPSNIFEGIYYRVLSLVQEYAPWTYVGAGMLGAAILVVLFRRFFSFQIGIGRRQSHAQDEQ